MESPAKHFVAAGALLAAIGVGLGAFGAHALRRSLSIEMLAVFETGVRYHMYHSFALIAVGLVLSRSGPSPLLKTAGWLFVSGIAVFSGSLYLLALTAEPSWGMLTPLGGVGFLAGWGIVAFSVWRNR